MGSQEEYEAEKLKAETEKARAEAEKARLEGRNLLRLARSDSTRFWTSVAAPLLTAIILGFTLVFQIYQFRRSSEFQASQSKNTSEDSQFYQMLTILQNQDILHGIQGVTLLKYFLASPRYHDQARDLAISLLPGFADADLFRSLFISVFAKTTWTDLDDIVRINARTVGFWFQARECLNALSPPPDKKPAPTPQEACPQRHPRVADLKRVVDQQVNEIRFTSAELAQLLKKSRPTVGPAPVNFSGVHFLEVDLSSVDLRKAALNDAWVESSDVAGADLGEVSVFTNSNWVETAWWRAKRISPELLKYLAAEYEFKSNTTYFNDHTKTVQEYQENLKRLQSTP